VSFVPEARARGVCNAPSHHHASPLGNVRRWRRVAPPAVGRTSFGGAQAANRSWNLICINVVRYPRASRRRK
jgi:hypothetical protein